jgi:hypothetical protein
MILSARRVRRTAPPTRTRFSMTGRGRRAADRRVSLSAPAVAAAGGIALGTLLEYFLDPNAGRRRRHVARDRALSRMRRGERRALVRARRTEAHAVGIARQTLSARWRHREPLDDVSLAHKVESELYQRERLPKGQIVVNAEDGVVFLRGVMERREDIERMEAAARHIAGVHGVENLLHAPGTPAPASRPKLERQQSSQRRADGSA